jgi:hypothetical protein
VVVGVFGYLGYENYVAKPMQEESTNLMAQAQAHFSEALEDPTLQDSLFVLALEGDGQNPWIYRNHQQLWWFCSC